ncbi:MAG: DUF348 domain-containing protein [Tissierellia bacterium]|nr:DUF348 domain-containing protein [Tissierellia bacterium]
MEEFSNTKANHIKVLTVLALATTLSLGVYMQSTKDITISIDDESYEIRTHANTLEELLSSEGIILGEKSYINTPLDAKLEDNMKIIIKTAKPYILSIGDKKLDIESVNTRVVDILKELDIELGEKDYTYPALNDQVAPGMEIQIIKVREVVEEAEETIPHDEIVKKTDKLDLGVVNVIQKGEDGLKKVKIKKVYENGQLISEDIIGEEVVKEPVPKITEKGTRNVKTSSRGNFRYKKVLTMTATAYDLSYESTGKRPGDKYYGITASGTKARRGVVAVDPRVIPLGTRLYVESLDGTKDYGFCVAEDTGGAIKGNKIDLFFPTAAEVRNFGRRKVKVYILE